MKPSIGDIEQNYEQNGRFSLDETSRFIYETISPLNLSSLSIISIILQYSFKMNSPKVLGILDLISGRHLFW